ncbi:MAG: Verru_Chthon cassette protein A [Chthoniobacterales bacterium]
MKHLSRKPSNHAFALVMVLIMILFAVTMAVMFLSSVGRERRGVDLYSRGNQAKTLSKTAVHFVMGQINAATHEGTAATPVSWASQPGMIRTYKANGSASNIYKLYSWSDMVQSGVGFDSTDTDQIPPAGWKNAVAQFTDLNQPISGVYPILDPAAEGKVQGFEIDDTNPIVSGSDNAAPMPVKWLYILKNGEILTPSGSGTQATFGGSTVPSDANPIVARMAFWTDDETSKVNVNTATEGAFWDWPKAATRDEMQFAGNPPLAGEYNRIPGHPAMTSLSAVFPELDPGDRWSMTSSYRGKLSDIMEIAPRSTYDSESSRGGTYPIESFAFDYSPSSTFSIALDKPILPDSDRLYATSDELLFMAANRTLNPFLSATDIRERGFFLTANSRAPETTLFETPRVSLWPITWAFNSAAQKSNPNRQTASVSNPNPDSTLLKNNEWMRPEERLLAFVSSLNTDKLDGGDRYFFQRQNPDSPTHDYDTIQRNKDLLAYLQRLTSAEIPGFGGNFQTKFGTYDRDTILANSLNLSRSLVNQYTRVATAGDARMLYSFTPIAFSLFQDKNNSGKKAYTEKGAFSPIPLRMNLGSGEIQTHGEFPALCQAALVFFATDREPPSLKTPANPADAGKSYFTSNPHNWNNLINFDVANGAPVGAQTKEMRAVLLLDFSPVEGSSRNNKPAFWVKVSGGGQANGRSLGFGGATLFDMSLQKVPSYLRALFHVDSSGDFVPKTISNSGSGADNYGLISGAIPVTSTLTQFPFAGSDLTVEVYGVKDGDITIDPTGDPSLRVATYTVDLSKWNGSLPVPIAPRWNYFDQMNTVGDCPNPRFNAYDYTETPDDDTTLKTEWAATEIAPRYYTTALHEDPALSPSGFVSTDKFNQAFQTYDNSEPKKGNFEYIPGTSGIKNRSIGYAYKDKNGTLMTDYEKRLNFLLYGIDRDLVFQAEHSHENFIQDGGAPKMAFDPGGFPAITAYDTVISMVPSPTSPEKGDLRIANNFTFDKIDTVLSGVPLREVFPYADYPRPNRQWHSLGGINGTVAATGYSFANATSLLAADLAPDGIAYVGKMTSGSGSQIGELGYARSATPPKMDADHYVGVKSAFPQANISAGKAAGDFASAPGNLADGAIFVRADQDYQRIYTEMSGSLSGNTAEVPYFQKKTAWGVDASLAGASFSPNRQIPSPISILGQLPESSTVGWTTLAFSPNPAAGSTHPGLASPPDHLLLDLFWMPVCEPYPISETFSTAGKINLNCKIAPFSYIKRETGIYALLKSTWMTAVHDSLAGIYKAHRYAREASNNRTRYPIDIEKTLEIFDSKVFAHGEIFRSASQLCEIGLVPEGESAGSLTSFWNQRNLTSDTAREQPYDHIYSRATTKSNTFTVHWKVQVLRKIPATAANIWDEEKDQVAAELRGSSLIERYLDPSITDIPDYATQTDATPLTHFYNWRIVSEAQFRP